MRAAASTPRSSAVTPTIHRHPNPDWHSNSGALQSASSTLRHDRPNHNLPLVDGAL
jgi:hypothetical protein